MDIDKTIAPYLSPLALAHPTGPQSNLVRMRELCKNGDAQVQSEVVCNPFAGLFCATARLSVLRTLFVCVGCS